MKRLLVLDVPFIQDDFQCENFCEEIRLRCYLVQKVR